MEYNPLKTDNSKVGVIQEYDEKIRESYDVFEETEKQMEANDYGKRMREQVELEIMTGGGKDDEVDLDKINVEFVGDNPSDDDDSSGNLSSVLSDKAVDDVINQFDKTQSEVADPTDIKLQIDEDSDDDSGGNISDVLSDGAVDNIVGEIVSGDEDLDSQSDASDVSSFKGDEDSDIDDEDQEDDKSVDPPSESFEGDDESDFEDDKSVAPSESFEGDLDEPIINIPSPTPSEFSDDSDSEDRGHEEEFEKLFELVGGNPTQQGATEVIPLPTEEKIGSAKKDLEASSELEIPWDFTKPEDVSFSIEPETETGLYVARPETPETEVARPETPETEVAKSEEQPKEPEKEQVAELAKPEPESEAELAKPEEEEGSLEPPSLASSMVSSVEATPPPEADPFEDPPETGAEFLVKLAKSTPQGPSEGSITSGINPVEIPSSEKLESNKPITSPLLQEETLAPEMEEEGVEAIVQKEPKEIKMVEGVSEGDPAATITGSDVPQTPKQMSEEEISDDDEGIYGPGLPEEETIVPEVQPKEPEEEIPALPGPQREVLPEPEEAKPEAEAKPVLPEVEAKPVVEQPEVEEKKVEIEPEAKPEVQPKEPEVKPAIPRKVKLNPRPKGQKIKVTAIEEPIGKQDVESLTAELQQYKDANQFLLAELDDSHFVLDEFYNHITQLYKVFAATGESFPNFDIVNEAYKKVKKNYNSLLK